MAPTRQQWPRGKEIHLSRAIRFLCHSEAICFGRSSAVTGVAAVGLFDWFVFR